MNQMLLKPAHHLTCKYCFCGQPDKCPEEIEEDNLIWVLDLRNQTIYELDSEVEVHG